MHHWHSGQPPLPYLCVLRWHPAQRQTRSPGQVSDRIRAKFGPGAIRPATTLLRVS
ncbi:hypothetical protein [Streptomyces mirabilis]|uniref:hypothetical protein n=1 Tax=Streptomyces mirabilis TaxID=68239 RepID=UPI00367F92C5